MVDFFDWGEGCHLVGRESDRLWVRPSTWLVPIIHTNVWGRQVTVFAER